MTTYLVRFHITTDVDVNSLTRDLNNLLTDFIDDNEILGNFCVVEIDENEK